MNPNSSHQEWSLWVAEVRVPFARTHALDVFFEELRTQTARFYRRLFGSTTELRITRRVEQDQTVIEVSCRTEGEPVAEPTFRQKRMGEISRFFGHRLRRYGAVDVRIDVKVEAGETGDGSPRAQLIIGPPIELLPRSTLLGR